MQPDSEIRVECWGEDSEILTQERRGSEVKMRALTRNKVSEWSLISSIIYSDPFNEVELDIIFEGENDGQYCVPAFWAGGSLWKFRFAPPDTGNYTYKTICSDKTNTDLHEQQGSFVALPYTGDNPLYIHGRIQVAPDKRHFEHSDGKPFFWLADTWWMGLLRQTSVAEGFPHPCYGPRRKGLQRNTNRCGLVSRYAGIRRERRERSRFPVDTGF